MKGDGDGAEPDDTWTYRVYSKDDQIDFAVRGQGEVGDLGRELADLELVGDEFLTWTVREG